MCVLSILLNQYIVASSALECGFWQIIIAAMSAGTTITFLLVALKDPGIIRKDRIPIPDEEAELERMPYCDICDLYQPTRVVHCATCNCCIVGLDHHCPYVSLCLLLILTHSMFDRCILILCAGWKMHRKGKHVLFQNL